MSLQPKALVKTVVVGTVAATTLIGLSSPAQAATNPYTARGVCGASYTTTVDVATIDTGRIYLLYSASTGKNCVVTIKTADVGERTDVVAGLAVVGGDVNTDSGLYRYYAGPVKLYARGRCVVYGGGVNDNSWVSGKVGCR